MDRITRFSLKNSAAVILVALLVTAGGLWSAMQLKKETMPDVTIPIVAIVTPYPGAAPADVYTDVTESMEKAVRGVEGVKRVTATSNDSVSAVVAEFSFSQDMDKAEQNINKAIDSVKLPSTAMDPTVSRISFGSAPILRLALIAESDREVEQLRAQVREDVLPALQGVEGVGQATLAADAPYSVRIELDPERLDDEGLTADSVIQQLQAANLSFPVGALEGKKTSEPIRVSGTIDSVEDIEDFRIAVYPDSNEIMAEAFEGIGDGMSALGQAVGAIGAGMGQGFSQLGSATGEIGMQAGMINGIQQIQSQLYSLKYDTLPALKAAQSQVPSDTPQYTQLTAQIDQIETQAIPGMQAAIDGLQSEITASQKALQKQASSMSSSGGGSGISMPSSSKSSSSSTPEMKIDVVTLSEVADITYGPSDGSVGTRANGKPAALIEIVKTQDANTVDVSTRVLEEVESQKASLPKGTELLTVYDASKAINASVDGMMREGMLGALFAVIVILLFLRNWRATIIAAVSIPLSVLIAMVLLHQVGVTLNVMTLGGLTVAIGRVVDDSIVVIENIFRHIQRGDHRGPELVRVATAEVASAITSSTLTTVAVFLPLGLVTGVIGKIFLPFALTVAMSLLASLLVAVTIVPLLAKWFLLNGKAPDHGVGESKPMALYKRILGWSLAHRWVVIAGAVALFAGSLALVPIIGTGFVPETKEKYIQVDVTYPQGTKAIVVDESVRGIEKALSESKEIELYQSTVGGSSTALSMSSGLGGTNTANTFARLAEDADTDAVIEELKGKTANFEKDGAEINYTRVDSSGTNSSLEVIVSGADLATIRTASDRIEKLLSTQKGLENVSSNLSESRKQVVVDVDQSKASKYGMNAAMVAGTVRGYVAQQDVGSVKIDGESTDVTYVLALDEDQKADEMAGLKLTTPLGKTVRLDKIASVEETDSPISVLTRDGAQYASVGGRITERDSGSVISEVREAVDALELPEGVTTEIGGTAEQMNESFSQLGVAMIIAVGAVYLVMIIAFGEAVAPLAIMFSLPLAVVGGLVGLLVAGVPLDIPAMIGALMLIGIVVTNAIVLVDRVQQKRRAGLSRRDALLEAGATRMRPILMTAVATIGALAPLASGFAEGALISQSLAVIVIGGLTTSTLLTLVVVPVAYDLLEGAKERIFGHNEAVAVEEHPA